MAEKEELEFDLDKIEPVKRDKVKNVSVLLWGKTKAGKSTYANTFPKPIIFDFEGTSGGVEGAKVLRVTDFEMFHKAWKQALEKNYETVVIDGAEYWLSMLQDNTLKRMGRKSMSDMKFGDTYQQFRKDAKETITKLLGRGKNIIFIFHETTAEYVNESTDETYNVRQPNISDKILIEAIPALFDIVANIEIKVDDTGKKTRLLDCTMNKYKMTGNRFGIEDILTLDYKELESRIIKK